MPPQRKVTAPIRRRIVAAARKGDSYATIAAWAGVSRERVRQIIVEDAPDFVSPRAPHLQAQRDKTPAEVLCVEGACVICGGQVCPPRTTYCDQECAEAGKVWQRVLSPQSHQRAVAKYTLANSDDPVQRRWARRVLKAGTTKRWLLEGSRSYETLKRHGLLERLPAEVEIL